MILDSFSFTIPPAAAVLAVAIAAASHLRARRYRRERDDARDRATRLWNRWRATLGRTTEERAAAAAAAGSATGGASPAPETFEAFADGLSRFDSLENDIVPMPAVPPGAEPHLAEPAEPAEPVILKFRMWRECR